jgi:hypothetical protein
MTGDDTTTTPPVVPREAVRPVSSTENAGNYRPRSRQNSRTRQNSRDEMITFNPTTAASMNNRRVLFSEAARRDGGDNNVAAPEMMGPILRRKKVVSMPLGAGGDFFVSNDVGGPHRQMLAQYKGVRGDKTTFKGRTKQKSVGAAFVTPADPDPTTVTLPQARIRQDSGTRRDLSHVIKGVLRRKQVSLDLLGPNDFFALPTDEPEEMVLLPIMPEDDTAQLDDEQGSMTTEKRLFRPLRFAPRIGVRGNRGGGYGVGHAVEAAPETIPEEAVDEEMVDAFHRYSKTNQDLRLQVISLKNKLATKSDCSALMEEADSILRTHSELNPDEQLLKRKIMKVQGSIDEEHECSEGIDNNIKDLDNLGIIRATRRDYIKTGILFMIMVALTITVSTWKTHLDEESFIFRHVGLACVTECRGNLLTRDFFHGHNQFNDGDVIELIMHMDPNSLAETMGALALVQIVGTETNETKAMTTFGPTAVNDRETYDHRLVVNFDRPHEPHIIVVNSTKPNFELSFTLTARLLAPLADNSVAIAAVIMVVVYLFILLEVIHRTLVAIFGSMVALMFLFVMQNGETESIRQIMLNLEWSTLGLLFGMMLIVGELSHTGVFEWCAVRLLMASNGSFTRLIVLLCALTAVASAFLDNVTTMLLVAPVTIDMCNILGVDPRPYLIGEVLLSNIGGTATLIGDPPNIIIGSSFDEIGFVDFIVNVLPCIFLLCIPVSLGLVVWVYRYYLTTSTMKVLDTAKLKTAYPIYDEPRLMIAGTVTAFVIIMFFLHPVHHKDTAWIALLGAFITIAFTNPHDVQDAVCPGYITEFFGMDSHSIPHLLSFSSETMLSGTPFYFLRDCLF